MSIFTYLQSWEPEISEFKGNKFKDQNSDNFKGNLLGNNDIFTYLQLLLAEKH